MDLIKLDQISYLGRLEDINLALNNHRLVGVIGPNGAGKSTLLRTISGLLRPTSGQVEIADENIQDIDRRSLAKLVSWIPQNAEIGWPICVRDAVMIGAMHQSSPNESADSALQQCNLGGLAERPLSELSGGELARVWVARALANKPQILLADEPIAALDLKYQLEVMQLFKDFSRNEGLAVVILHDINLAARYCDEIILLDDGQLVAYGPTPEVLNSKSLSEVFDVKIEQAPIHNRTIYTASPND